MSESTDVTMTGFAVDCAIGGKSDDQSGGGRKNDGGAMSPLEAVGHLYAMDGTIKQMSFLSDTHYADMDIYLDDLRAKLTTTFLELLDKKHSINLWVAVSSMEI